MGSQVFLVQPDPFSSQSDKLADFIPSAKAAQAKGGSKDPFKRDAIHDVSRPVRGFTAKPNTFAYVQVINANGEVQKVFNRLETNVAGGKAEAKTTIETATASPKQMAQAGNKPQSHVWTDWILQAVREERMEKTQIVETFGETYLYAFGEKPRALVFTGMLMNTVDYNWKSVFWENWERFFRATKLTQMNARMYIGWDDVIVEGYPVNAVVNQSADSPNAMSFSFNFMVTNYVSLAAHTGFQETLAPSIGSVRSGYQTGVARLKSSRRSFFKYLGVDGADALGRVAYDKLVKAKMNPHYASLVGQSVAGLALESLQADWAMLGGANSAAAGRSITSRATLSFLQALKSGAIDDLEDELRLERGEINAWFGLLGTVIGKAQTAAGLQGQNTADYMNMSFDQIAQDMAYRAGSKKVAVPGVISVVTSPFT